MANLTILSNIIDLILIFLIQEATEVKKHFLHMSQIQIFISFSLFRRYKDEK